MTCDPNQPPDFRLWKKLAISRASIRLFSGGEVGPARHFGPLLNVVSALDPAPRRERIFLGEVCDGAGHANPLARFELERRFFDS